MNVKKDFAQGAKSGLPIGIGYFSVSFGVGILAVSSGLSPLMAAAISAFNLTSAGQVAGIGVMAAGGSMLEMALTQLVINCRYSLMALSLSQNLSPEFTLPHKMAAAYGITDEIFGVASARKEPLTPFYMYGMILTAAVGWVSGTALGALCGQLLPERLTSALGILLYGMFMAIIIPPIHEHREVLYTVLIAAAVSCLIYYLLPAVSSGFSIIISGAAAAALMALLFPIPEETEGQKQAAENEGGDAG